MDEGYTLLPHPLPFDACRVQIWLNIWVELRC